MRFSLIIESNNDAMQSVNGLLYVLDRVTKRLDGGDYHGTLLDINGGARVGAYTYDPHHDADAVFTDDLAINDRRAAWARIALQQFADLTRHLMVDRDLTDEDARTEAAGDMLGDLIHYLGPDRFEQCLERGRAYYTEEFLED